MEKMFNYLLFASMPDGRIPGLNDSGNASVKQLLFTGFKLFPEREDFLYVATDRQRGHEPDHRSHAFPWSGHYVMRSGWDAEAAYLLFDAGPYGYGHQHEDKLHFVLWSHGRQLLLDPGNFSYDRSRWRRYVLSTRGHNTIMVDGQDQQRRGKRETYFWPRPWTGKQPDSYDARWLSTMKYDFAAGVYNDGYGRGRKLTVIHRRRVLFVKPSYFIVVDVLEPADDEEHVYEALFHLDTKEATTEGLTVQSQNEGESNVRVLSRPDSATTLSIVKGKGDEPVQGWSSGPWRAIPTAIFRKAAKGMVRMAFVVVPWGKGQVCPVASVSAAEVEGAGIGGVIRLAVGGTHRFLFPDDRGEPVRMGKLNCEDEALVEMCDEGGNVKRTLRVGGE